jgi:hypothetical protein
MRLCRLHRHGCVRWRGHWLDDLGRDMTQHPQRVTPSPLQRADGGPVVLPDWPATLPHTLRRFLDTLGMADDPVWKPAHPDQEPPF